MDVFSKRNVNIIFLVIFLIEIIFGIIGTFILPLRIEYLAVLVSVIFVSGIHTVNNLFQIECFAVIIIEKTN